MIETKEDILEQALNLVSGDRAEQHGDFFAQHQRAAKLISSFLGFVVEASDVAMILALVKISRTKGGSFNIDDYVDGAGYFGIAGACRHREVGASHGAPEITYLQEKANAAKGNDQKRSQESS